MGNNQTQQQLASTHALYGEPKNVVVNKDQKTHVVSFAVADEEQGRKFINRFNITDSFNKRHLLLSNNFNMENAFLCGKSKNFNCTFPFYPYSLEQELQRKSQEKTFLPKEQLTYLLYQIIDAARNFDRIDEKVGDIRPAQILLDETKKKIKLVNFFTSPNQPSGLEKALDLKEKTFLAPQQLKSLQKNNPVPDINVHKADAFSLGLTILAIGNLKKLHDQLYDWSEFSFSWTQLSNELETFQNRYGSFLAQIVKGFLQNQPRNRLYIGQVGSLLQFYEKHIYEMLDFDPDFSLLQKTYQLNYSGPRSQGFLKWLVVCRQFYVKKVTIHHQRPIVPVVQVKKVFVNPPIVVSEAPKVQNSRVKFYYTSPSVVKNGHTQ